MTLSVDGKTQLLGLFGYPVKHTASPAMQNAALAALKINCVYLPFEVSPNHLGQAVGGLRALNFLGANVTVPYKQDVIEFLDGISGEARLIGAVNTIKVEGKRIVGYNTDGRGFVRSLKEEAGFNFAKKRMVLIGAGGAGRAVAVQSGLEGLGHLAVADEQESRAESLAEHVSAKIPGCEASAMQVGDKEFADALAEADVVVDATPLGMHSSDPTSFDPALLQKGTIVVDLVYNPPATKLLRAAQKRGCKVFNGLGMLLYQGAIALELWTGRKAPIEIMRSALKKAIA